MDQLKGMVAQEQHNDFLRKMENDEAIRILKAANKRPSIVQRMKRLFTRRPTSPQIVVLKSQKKH